MSVLLEALKKAAEEKNKNAKQSAGHMAGTSAPHSSSENATEKTVNEGEAKSQESASLKMLDSVATPKSSSFELDEMIEESVKSSSTLTPSINANKTEEDIVLESRDKQSASSKLTFSLAKEVKVEEREASIEIPGVPDVPEQFDDLAENSIKPSIDIKTNILANASAQNNASQTDEAEKESKVNSGNETVTMQGKDEIVDTVKDESYEWGLDQLPAYLPEENTASKATLEQNPESAKSVQQIAKDSKTDASDLAKNSVLTKSAHAKPYTTKKSFKVNPKVALGFISLTVFSLIGAYSAYYYQQENQRLEASFVKYKIDPIEVELPSKKIIEKEEQLVGIASENVVGPTADNGDQSIPNEGQQVPVVPESDTTADMPIASDMNDASVKATSNKLAPPVKESATKTASAAAKTTSPSKPKVKPLKSNDNVLVLNTGVSTVIQPKASSAKTAITKSKALTPKQVQLSQAYKDYENANWQVAQAGFKKVLESEPDNLKAMLGLAATQNYLGDTESSLATYQQVLKKNPGNNYALEAVAEIANSVSQPNTEWVQQLTELTEKYPNSAVLQNALGNAYAKQKNWFKAQQNYFNAVAIKDTESTYLMNLAVSLDHLGKHQPAEDYYTKALVYSKNSQSLNQEAIKKRLLVLRQFRNSE